MTNRNRISLVQRTFAASALAVLATLATSTAAFADDPFVPDLGTCTTNVLGGPATECGTESAPTPVLTPDPGTCTTNVLGGGASQCGVAPASVNPTPVTPHHRKPRHWHHHR